MDMKWKSVDIVKCETTKAHGHVLWFDMWAKPLSSGQ